MNAIIQNMLDRHSCRSFTDQPIEQEKLDDLITAAVWAPSGMNKQTWHFTLITDTEKIQQLAAAIRKADNRPANYNFYAPTAFFIVSGERDNRNSMLDGAAALENVLLLPPRSAWAAAGSIRCATPVTRPRFVHC